jgi:ring-1,2-phenylacetyl-CoA epoxidase subunit PaaD
VVTAPTATPTLEAAVRAALAAVPDPELPVVSVVDLGMVHAVDVGAADGEPIRVAVLPTFLGCPAGAIIGDAIREGLAGFGRPVVVESTLAVPWSTDRITPEGLAALAAAGIAPPTAEADVRCPWCSSERVVQDNAFGPTPCRSLYFCRECRQPFEAMKPV